MNNLWQVDIKQSKEDGEKYFNQISNEERAKFDEETLVNLNNTEKKSIKAQSDMFRNEDSMVWSDYLKATIIYASISWSQHAKWLL